MRLLLLSNSTGPSGGYLDWCEGAITAFVGEAKHVLFIPFAGIDEQAYGESAVVRLAAMGLEARWFDRSTSSPSALNEAEVVFVGGGNTFLLLDRLISTGMLDAVRNAVGSGLPYIGASAGTNVTSPTIRTTNDMPIVRPPSDNALALVPFQINPHYLDADPTSTHQGETRQQRLTEYLALNETPVVALREGTFLEVSDTVVVLHGEAGGLAFRRGLDPLDIEPGMRVDRLLEPGSIAQPNARGN